VMAPGAYVLRLRPSLTQMFREVGVGTISEVLDLRLCCLGKPTSYTHSHHLLLPVSLDSVSYLAMLVFSAKGLYMFDYLSR
jgi:hypothetical protein